MQTKENDIYIGFYEDKLIGPGGSVLSDGSKFNCHLEVLYPKLSIIQATALVKAFQKDDQIYCFECEIKRIDEDCRSLLLKIATANFPYPQPGADAFEIAKPVMVRVQAITAEVLGVELPPVYFDNLNFKAHPDTIEKQILAERGLTNESRPKQQVNIKLNKAKTAAKKRRKIISELKN